MAQCATHSCAYQQNLEKQKHYSDRSCSTRRALIGENTVCFLHKQCLSYFKVSVFFILAVCIRVLVPFLIEFTLLFYHTSRDF